MAEIDQNLISHFLCTHKLDSTKVDMDPYLMENDLIFFPVKGPMNIQQVHGGSTNMDRYLERIDTLFNPYREKN